MCSMYHGFMYSVFYAYTFEYNSVFFSKSGVVCFSLTPLRKLKEDLSSLPKPKTDTYGGHNIFSPLFERLLVALDSEEGVQGLILA